MIKGESTSMLDAHRNQSASVLAENQVFVPTDKPLDLQFMLLGISNFTSNQLLTNSALQSDQYPSNRIVRITECGRK